MEVINAQIQLRSDAKSEWENVNPVLAQGEPGVIIGGSDHGKMKFGDGVRNWNSLPYANSGEIKLGNGLNWVNTPYGPELHLSQLDSGVSMGDLQFAPGTVLLATSLVQDNPRINSQVFPCYTGDTNFSGCCSNPVNMILTYSYSYSFIALPGVWVIAGYYASPLDYFYPNSKPVLIRRIA